MANRWPKVALINEHEALLYRDGRAPLRLVSSDRHVMLLVDVVLAPPGFRTLTAYLACLAIADADTMPGLADEVTEPGLKVA